MISSISIEMLEKQLQSGDVEKQKYREFFWQSGEIIGQGNINQPVTRSQTYNKRVVLKYFTKATEKRMCRNPFCKRDSNTDIFL